MDGSTKTQRIKLVLLPGMDGTGDLFADFIAALPESFETVTVRYPTDRCLSYSELSELVQVSCPVSEPFVLVAESYSTPLAIECGASNLGGLQGLVLCAGFATSPAQGWCRSLGLLLATFLCRVPLPNLVAKLWLVGSDASPSLVTAVQLAISSVRPEVLAARLRAVLGCNVRAELSRITVPVLYVRAKQDHLVSASCLAVIQQSKPDVKVAVLDGPHLLLQRYPLRAAAVIVEFVRHTLQSCRAAHGLE
jgi:pimeloyl-ACP methyl ester carboxylesterase